jgi:DNA-binding transcriptional ArsR family regulator
MLNYQVRVGRIFRALGDQTRFAMVNALSGRRMSVSQLADACDVTLPNIIQHLEILEDAGIVTSEKVGRVRTCGIVPESLSLVEQWIADRRTLWERRFDLLGEVIAETKKRRSTP